MISAGQIIQDNLDAAKHAKRVGARPLLITLEQWKRALAQAQVGDIPKGGWRKIPKIAPEHLERVTGKKWEEVERFFVDKGGLGGIWDAGGPALSIGGFLQEAVKLTEHKGSLAWVLADEGQFQIYVIAVRPKRRGWYLPRLLTQYVRIAAD